ncbi:MAG: hypothetical protein ABI947_23280 [Chloroflexota bacterium]
MRLPTQSTLTNYATKSSRRRRMPSLHREGIGLTNDLSRTAIKKIDLVQSQLEYA